MTAEESGAPEAGHAEPQHGYSPNKDNYAKRLRRVEGQVRGIAKMIDEDKYCIDVLTQISAIRSALDKVALGLVDDHVRHCLVAGHGGPEDPGEQADELMAVVGRFL